MVPYGNYQTLEPLEAVPEQESQTATPSAPSVASPSTISQKITRKSEFGFLKEELDEAVIMENIVENTKGGYILFNFISFVLF